MFRKRTYRFGVRHLEQMSEKRKSVAARGQCEVLGKAGDEVRRSGFIF